MKLAENIISKIQESNEAEELEKVKAELKDARKKREAAYKVFTKAKDALGSEDGAAWTKDKTASGLYKKYRAVNSIVFKLEDKAKALRHKVKGTVDYKDRTVARKLIMDKLPAGKKIVFDDYDMNDLPIFVETQDSKNYDETAEYYVDKRGKVHGP